MSRWFRFYADAMRNPKVSRLTDKEFRLWVELLGVAAENEGAIPCLDDLKHVLKRRLDHLSTGVERLISLGLIDRSTDGYAPHNWGKRQYKSDTSTDRVQKYRSKRNVSETPPDTEADTDTEEPPLAPKGATKAYAFVGKVCRLNRRDYDSFHGQFFAIPDFNAELAAFDGWASAQSEAKQAKWFGSLAPWLNKRHQEAMAAKAPARTVGVGV